MREKNKARTQLAGAPLLVGQLGALEFRKRMIQGDSGVLNSLRLGTQCTVAEVLKQLGQAPPLSLLQLCYNNRRFNFAEHMLQHADDLDFLQDVLTAKGNSSKINPILNGVLAGFNRRRRYQRIKYDHQNLEMDRLRFAETTNSKDDDLQSTDVLEASKEIETVKRSKTRVSSYNYPCRFYNRVNGCRNNRCQYIHKCAICNLPSHGAINCRSRGGRNEALTPGRPPDPRTRRDRVAQL